MSKVKTQQERKIHIEIIAQLTTLATSAFGLVAALAWNDAIQSIVNEYIETKIPGAGLLSKFIYALIVTILAVFITYQLSSLSSRFKKN